MSILWGVIPGLCCRWDSFQHSYQYHCNMHVHNQEDSFYHGRFWRIYRRTKNEYWRWRWPLWAEPKCNILVCPPPPNLQLVNTMMRTTTNLEMMMMLISRLQIYSWIKVHICISTSKDSGKKRLKKIIFGWMVLYHIKVDGLDWRNLQAVWKYEWGKYIYKWFAPNSGLHSHLSFSARVKFPETRDWKTFWKCCNKQQRNITICNLAGFNLQSGQIVNQHQSYTDGVVDDYSGCGGDDEDNDEDDHDVDHHHDHMLYM